MDWWLCRLQIKIKLKPMNEILSLAPQNVWKHFYSLTQVPRPSGHLAKVQSFLLEFGKNAGVEAFQDEAGNIIYRKPALRAWKTVRRLSCRHTWICSTKEQRYTA